MNHAFLLSGIIKQINQKILQKEINATWTDVYPRKNRIIKWDPQINIGHTYHKDDYDRKTIIK
tara:strand:+ start:214 stop:402 length:189 start_codon:yes stop_codon:yes gene_type:complete